MSTLDLNGNAVRGGTQVSLLSSPLSNGQWPKPKKPSNGAAGDNNNNKDEEQG